MMLPSSIAHVFPTSLGSFFIPIVSTVHPIISCSVLPWPFLHCDFYFVDVSSGAAPSAPAPTPLTEDCCEKVITRRQLKRRYVLRAGGVQRGPPTSTGKSVGVGAAPYEPQQARKSHAALCDGDR